MVVYSYVTITNVNDGEKGDTGATLYTWIKYSNGSPESMTDDPSGTTYIGIAYNKESTEESDNYDDYRWTLMKGKSIQSIAIEYALSSSKTEAPAEDYEGWSEIPPSYIDGYYMWSRTKIQYVDPISTEYSIALCDNNWDIFTDKIASVELDIDKLEKEISLKASTTEVTDAIGKAIEESENTINQKISELTLRDDEIAASVSNVQAEIKNKADGSTVSTLQTKITELEATDQGFTARFETTDAKITSWENSKSNLSMAITVSNEETSTTADGDDEHVQTTSTLTVHLLKGSVEITDTFDASEYSWTRRSELTTEDVEWNSVNHTGTSLTLAPEDKVNAAVYKCSITITSTNADGETETFPITAETMLFNDYFIADWTSSTSSSIAALQGNIALIVSEEDIAELSNGDKTVYQQMSSINIGLSEITSRVSNTESILGQHENTFTELRQTNESFSATIGQHEDKLNEMSSYMSYSRDADTGLGTLTLGENSGDESIDSFQLQLNNQQLSFLENGTTVAYMSNKQLHITDAQVNNIDAQTGSFYSLYIRDDFRIGDFIGKVITSGIRKGNVSWGIVSDTSS